MLNRLAQIEKNHADLTRRLGEGISNPAEFQQAAKEEAHLRPLVEMFRIYREKTSELKDNRTLENEKDETLKKMAREEISRLESEIVALEQELKIQLLPRDPNDEKNIYLEIRAGTGGDEAGLFAADLFRMYSRFAEREGWRVEIMSSNSTGVGGFKEMILMISGERVYSRLKHESGVHRVQRVPKTEASGRIHTSAVTVAVMPEADEVEVDLPEKDLRIDVYRSGGHGGQSVNTTDSAVRITHLPTNMVVICQDEKSQHKNKAKAMKVLRARLYDKKLQDQQDAAARERKEQVKSGDRSEKIRTYNFPQNRLTDHRIGLTLYQLDSIIDGNLEPLISPLQAHFQAEALKTG
ncbi:MAG: peptide chain release factor 1 [Deltaproteobacteria bacterium]|nr:peptide chain release factor 1 [Deltaproteobacteria bacterium]